MSAKIYIFSLFIFIVSCNNNLNTTDSHINELKKYISEKNIYKKSGKQLYVLLHPDYCGSCTVSIQEFVRDEFIKCSNVGKNLILSSEKEDITKRFRGVPNLITIVDDENELPKYDLANGLEMFIFEDNGNLIKSGIINLEQIDNGLTLCE